MKYSDIKTFDDACKVLELDPCNVLPDFSIYPESDREGMLAHAMLVIIAKAANKLANKGEEWKPDWSRWDEPKYYPWFEMAGSSGFRCDGYDYWFTHSTVGSRLCFIYSEVAVYVGKQFEELYKAYFTL